MGETRMQSLNLIVYVRGSFLANLTLDGISCGFHNYTKLDQSNAHFA